MVQNEPAYGTAEQPPWHTASVPPGRGNVEEHQSTLALVRLEIHRWTPKEVDDPPGVKFPAVFSGVNRTNDVLKALWGISAHRSDADSRCQTSISVRLFDFRADRWCVQAERSSCRTLNPIWSLGGWTIVTLNEPAGDQEVEYILWSSRGRVGLYSGADSDSVPVKTETGSSRVPSSTIQTGLCFLPLINWQVPNSRC